MEVKCNENECFHFYNRISYVADICIANGAKYVGRGLLK